MTRQGMDMRKDYIHLKWECEALWLEWSPLCGRCLSAGSVRQAGKGAARPAPFQPQAAPAVRETPGKKRRTRSRRNYMRAKL